MNLLELCNRINDCLKHGARVEVTYLPDDASSLNDIDFTLFDPDNDVNSCGMIHTVLQSAFIYDQRKSTYGIELLTYDDYEELRKLIKDTELVLSISDDTLNQEYSLMTFTIV